MKLTWLCAALLFAGAAAPLAAQVSDRCAPGWSLLNQLKEELSPDMTGEKLALLRSTAENRLGNCRDIPDLWYYRSRISDRMKDSKDATYALRVAKELGSAAASAGLDPFTPVVAKSGSPLSSPLSGTIREKWALVVGIGQFQDTQSIPALGHTVDDAKAFAALLADDHGGRFKPENISLLLNEQATLLGIRTAIGRIRERAKPDDLVVLYIASHGSPRSSDPNGVSYVITNDTRLDDAASLYATSLQMIDLVQLLRRDVQARRVVLILDTCYSGDATGSRGVMKMASNAAGARNDFSGALDGFAKDGARVVMSASRAEQQSWESNQLKHGYFTYFLLEALRQSQGQMPLGQIFETVRDRTAAAVHKDHPNAEQTPTIQENSDGAAIVLGAATGQ
jgi:uncharacterized caspase-like protein